jgi:subtilisin family serine protease/photosystem II stability/assembly factor-like uncharacterized protein
MLLKSFYWLPFALLVAVRLAASEPAKFESRLDPALKLLVRAQSVAESIGGKAVPPGTITEKLAFRIISRFHPKAVETSSNSSLLLVVTYAGDDRRLAEAGFKVQSHVGSSYSGTLDPRKLRNFAALPGMVFIELSRPLQSFRAPTESQAPNLQPSSYLPEPDILAAVPQAGSGALVAIIDSGVDIRHYDFRHTDGTTRIKYLLDLSEPGDIDGNGTLDGPDEFGGTLYTESQINRILQSSAPAKTRDSTGHGTHALSVAAGSDSQLPGIAPGASLIVVKATRQDGTLDFETADLLSALSFVDQKAAELGLPYVVNLSLGTSYGPHDGRTAEELAIDSLVGPGIPGKAVVLAAGNSDLRGTKKYRHFQGTTYTGFENRHTLTIPPYTAPTSGAGNDLALLDLWYEGDDQLTVSVTAPDGATVVEAHYGDFADVATPFGQVFIGNMGGRDPRNGATEAVILLYDESGTAPAAGNWTITVHGEAVKSTGLYNGWLVDGVSLVGGAEPYLSQNADNEYLIARPAAADNGIAVGSFARHDPAGLWRTTWTDVRGLLHADAGAHKEDLSFFSSTGPTRDGRVKPEIVAPGEFVVGAVSRDAYPGHSPHSIFSQHPFSDIEALILKNQPGHVFGVMEGTSFAAPVVTGLVARLLAKNPSLDAIQVKNILLNTALTDSFTSSVPNELWGYGKAQLGLALSSGSSLPSTLRINPDVLPSGVTAEQYDQSLAASGGKSPYSWRVVSGSLPDGLSLANGPILTGIPSRSATFSFTVEAKDSSAPPKVVRHPFRIVVTDTVPLHIDTSNLPAGDLTNPYRASLLALGGTPPYVWSLAGGQLPTGLSLLPDGTLAGVPLVQGPYFLTVEVKDTVGTAALRSLRVDILDPTHVVWQPVGLDDVFVRQVIVDPNNSDHLVAAVSTLPRHYAIFESLDKGHGWNGISLHNGLDFDEAAALGMDPVTSDLWALGYYPRLPFRYDGTQQQWIPWSNCYTRPQQFNATAMIDLGFDTAGKIFLLPYYTECPLMPANDAFRGFLRSVDGGGSWHNIGLFPTAGSPDLSGSREQLGHLSVFLSNSQYLYASRTKEWRCCEPVEEQFFRSSDGGISWIELPVSTESVSTPYVSQTDPFDIVRAPWNPDEYSSLPWAPEYAGKSIIERSVDGGVTWLSHQLPGDVRLCRLERSTSEPSVLLAGTTTGLLKSADSGTTWQQLTIPGITQNFCAGGALTIDPTNPLIYYVGLKNGRIATSMDEGVSWEVGGENLLQRKTSGIALSSARPTDLLLIAGAPFVSRTNGARWTFSANGIITTFTKSGSQYPVISEADPDLFFFVDADGWDLYRSTNRGLLWEKLEPVFGAPTTITPQYSYQPHILSLVADPFNAEALIARVLFFVTQNGSLSESESMWKSEDRGSTWTQIPEAESSIFYSDQTQPSVTFAHDAPGHLYALGLSKLYESVNGGALWTPISQLNDSQGGGFLVVRPAPSDPRYLYVIADASVGAYDARSASWNWNTFVYYSHFSSLAVDPNDPSMAYLGRYYSLWEDSTGIHNSNNGTGGIDKTTDGGRSWVRLASFPTNLSVISLETDPQVSGIVYAATLEDGVYRSQDGGATWEKLNNYGVVGDVVNVAVKDPVNPQLLFAGTEGFGVQVSTNGGQDFVARVKGLTNLNVTSLAFDQGSPEILYAGTENGLFKTLDAGSTWIRTALADGVVTDISVDTGSRPRRIRITTLQLGLASSQDEGATFSYSTAGLGSLNLTSIRSEPHGKAQRLWVTIRGGDGVVVSDDAGKTWRSAAGPGLSNRNVNQLAIESATHRKWVATDGGVFVTDNDGKAWTSFSGGLPQGVPITSLSFNADTGELFASLYDAHNGGVFRGANIQGVWSNFNEGLPELRVRNISNDGGHVTSGGSRTTTFFASTSGDGLFSIDLSSGNGLPYIVTSTLADAVSGVLYEQLLAAAGGLVPYSWRVAAGVLPPGLNLEASTGVLMGVPVGTGLFAFTVEVADANSQTTRQNLTLLVRGSAASLRDQESSRGPAEPEPHRGQVSSEQKP